MAKKAAPKSNATQAGTGLGETLRNAFLRRAQSAAGEASKKTATAKKTKKKKKTAARKKTSSKSPLAPKSFPKLPELAGVELSSAAAGVKYEGRDDLLAVRLAPGTAAAGVFTTSKTAAAPVDWCRSNLLQKGEDSPSGGAARLLIVNSGNANAFTGKAGMDAVKKCVAAGAKLVNAPQREVFMASTGVIGESLPAYKIVRKLPATLREATPSAWKEAAAAIMTTDTFPKGVTRTAEIDGEQYQINGIAKGSGMIAPDMATMLAFVFTDAGIPKDVLQTLLILSVRDSFNAITVDSDTSTSDTVLLFATGKGPAHDPITRAGDRRLKDFREKLQEVMTDLACQIVRDGEGATKFLTIRVAGAASAKAARTIAFAVANSPLVKTAAAGEDPNWGRIVMAVGKSGEEADRDKLAIQIGGLPVAENGEVHPKYEEAETAKLMKKPEIEIEGDVGVGSGSATVWTCDMTHGYISINADYRS